MERSDDDNFYDVLFTSRHTASEEVENENDSRADAHPRSLSHRHNHHRMELEYFADELLSLSRPVKLFFLYCFE